MAESEIPADIRATAKAVRDKLCLDCECTFDRGCGCLDALHEALLAERERAARIAKNHGIIVSNDIIGKACANNIAHEIRDPNCVLAAIRQDNPNAPTS